MKKLLLICTVLFCLSYHSMAIAQDNKFNDLATPHGKIVKYIDMAMPNINVAGAVLSQLTTPVGSNRTIYDIETRIRYSYNEDKMYCCLVYKDGHIIHTELICYEELVQINNALQRLQKESESDKNIQPPHLINEYKTSNGVSIGYEIMGSSVLWYIDLGHKIVKAPIHIKNGIAMIETFQSIQKKMEELSK